VQGYEEEKYKYRFIFRGNTCLRIITKAAILSAPG